ncbi:probable starch synthase 4, chloroplastic/amyloplastic isoform X3 [Cucurbita pepo subsp. pepo]|uniref:probable starch synthase 4, chloroplastic/amyloplastic isoform X3 n=1 Tax=Cucurbita pepo subsp. pepo TaxID=3664 RepID=UPI000C9D7EA7|nr:probable starch synthase 4, chloroplastic/amyloplastic isoform X3 [Cucurbita pepo subsp. pepo]
MAIHAFTTTGFSFHLPFPKCTTAYSRSAGDRARTLCCSSGDGDLSGLINVSSESEFGRRGGAQMAKSSDGKRSIQSSDGELRAKNSEIWQLFREAQRNILSLDKQRALAVEELNKAISEKKLLLERIEELEIEKQAMARKVASFVTGLSQALQRKGNLVEVILPKYGSMDLNEVQGIRETEVEYYSYYNGQLHGNKIWTGVICGIGVTFIQPLYYSSFFNREKAYGYSDDFERFMYFSRAALDYIVKSGKKPDVLHIHNWQTAIIGPLFWDIFVQQGLEGSRILFTCHDIHSQPLIQPEKLALCGLDPTKLHRPDRLQDNSNTHLANIMKGGIVYSNKVVIMSSTHSKGHIIHSSSHGLETTLNMHKDKLLVSPCGFESSSWDPEKDKILPENYSADDMKGKSVCKIALQQKLRLPENASIITVGCFLSDLSDVDKEDLIAIVKNGTRMAVQFIFMTTGKMKSGQKELESLQVKIESLQDENIRFINRHDETLSHLIFGGSNIILCQSLHDPILQVPLKAMRYGAAPIAITSNDNGFRHFPDHDYETTKLAMFINSTFGYLSFSQALDEINNNPSEWNHKVFDAMTKDFSWDAECCDIYLSAYTAIKSL